MERLTKKNDCKEGTTIGMPRAVACYWKLKKYEDIEEDLGIDLSVLVKALKDEPYLKDTREDGTTFISQGVVHLEKECFGNNLTLCCGYKYPTHYRLEDYGKTWALTKEELE